MVRWQNVLPDKAGPSVLSDDVSYSLFFDQVADDAVPQPS